MLYAGIVAVASILALAFVLLHSSSEREKLLKEMALERGAWAQERRELNDRIQIPEAAPFIHGQVEQEPQFVPPEDDQAYWEAVEERG